MTVMTRTDMQTYPMGFMPVIAKGPIAKALPSSNPYPNPYPNPNPNLGNTRNRLSQRNCGMRQ